MMMLNTHPASRLWALSEAEPDSVPLSASLSLWYSTGDVEPGLMRTVQRQEKKQIRAVVALVSSAGG